MVSSPKETACYANRSAAYLRMRNFESALSDASKAIECDNKYPNAYYRRADVYMALRDYTVALENYEHAHKLLPYSEDVKRKMIKCWNQIVQDTASKKGKFQSYLIYDNNLIQFENPN